MRVKTDEFDIVEPDPGALSESLRAFGYSPETAIADLVDNSISAGATSIDVLFHWNGGESWVAIVDNGRGMDATELTLAMKPGSRSPLEERDPNDLGRFGLGLKTASFSQCRRLTVTSKKSGAPVCSRLWDLDEVALSHAWRLLHSDPTAGIELAQDMGDPETWTVVHWSHCDRIVGDFSVDDDAGQRDFNAVVERVATHLSMTFHKFLGGKKLQMRVNSRPLDRWDPFLDANPATQNLGSDRLEYPGGAAKVTSYVLPHRDKLAEEDFTRAGGPSGWNALQGFYVYRNNRLLVAGDWLGLRLTKEEHYKLARIEIEIGNETDEAWQIDVKKSTAVPPAAVRSHLAQVARVARERAVTVYRHRGKSIGAAANKGVSLLWDQKVRHGKVRYEISRSHPSVEAALQNPSKASVTALLRLIEETVPVPLITISASERPEEHAAPLEGVTDRQIVELARELFDAFRHRGESAEEAVSSVMSTDPFHLYPEIAESLSSNIEETMK